MQKAEFKLKINEIVKVLPESKLREVIDFASYLKDKQESEDNLKIQMNSKTYHEWLDQENDIYDEVFKDEI